MRGNEAHAHGVSLNPLNNSFCNVATLMTMSPTDVLDEFNSGKSCNKPRRNACTHP